MGFSITSYEASQVALVVKKQKTKNKKIPACQWRRCKRHGFDSWVRKIPQRRARQSTPFMLGECHEQKSLVDYMVHRAMKSQTWLKWIGRHAHITFYKKTLNECFGQLNSKVLVTQSCPTLRCPMDCSLPGSSVHGIFRARILKWFAISFSRASSIKNMLASTVREGFWEEIPILLNTLCVLDTL